MTCICSVRFCYRCGEFENRHDYYKCDNKDPFLKMIDEEIERKKI